MNDIQKARDVFAETRNLCSFGCDDYEYHFEKVGADGSGILWRRPTDVEADPEPELVAENLAKTDARFFFMMGNPDLLDAIEFSLAYVQQELDLYEGRELKHVRTEDNGVVETALRIAAAIISADERMRA